MQALEGRLVGFNLVLYPADECSKGTVVFFLLISDGLHSSLHLLHLLLQICYAAFAAATSNFSLPASVS
jgi:hypothetical protein